MFQVKKKKKKTLTKSFLILHMAYGEDCLSCKKWYKYFKFQRMSIKIWTPMHVNRWQSHLEYHIAGSQHKLPETKTRWIDDNKFTEKKEVRCVLKRKKIPFTLLVCFNLPLDRPQNRETQNVVFFCFWVERSSCSINCSPSSLWENVFLAFKELL